MIWQRVLAAAAACFIVFHAWAAETAETAPRFDVTEIRITGNTLLGSVDVEQTVYPFLGSEKTLQDIEAARIALEQRYRATGYPAVMVNIPEQDVKDGVVRLEVREGRIDQLRFTGSRYYSLNAMRARLPALAEGAPLYTPGVQTQVDALNTATGDRAVTPVLRPGRTPGTVEIELKVQDELPLHGSIELSDRYTHDTSKLRAGASLSYDNLWQRGHSLGVSYQTAPEKPDESRVLSSTYLWRFADSDAVLALYGVRTNSDTSTVGDLSVLGKGQIFGLRAVLPQHGPADMMRSFTLGLDYKDFKESVTLAGADTNNTPISYYVASAQFSSTLRAGQNTLRAGITAIAGVRGADADRVDCYGQSLDEFLCKRYGARANFTYLRGDVDYARTLPLNMQLAFNVEAQVANEPLISNEQFSVGGATSVRGYAESQAAGDSGVRGSLELRSPSWGAALSSHIQDLRALLFVDGATVRVIDALPGEDRTHQLSSAGLGVRARAFDALTLELDAAQVFHAANNVDKGDARAHFRIEYGF